MDLVGEGLLALSEADGHVDVVVDFGVELVGDSEGLLGSFRGEFEV